MKAILTCVHVLNIAAQDAYLEHAKSDVHLLEEYATAIHKEIRYVHKPLASRSSFEIKIGLDDKTANGVGAKKKVAEAAAAHSSIEKIGKTKIIERLTQHVQ